MIPKVSGREEDDHERLTHRIEPPGACGAFDSGI